MCVFFWGGHVIGSVVVLNLIFSRNIYQVEKASQLVTFLLFLVRNPCMGDWTVTLSSADMVHGKYREKKFRNVSNGLTVKHSYVWCLHEGQVAFRDWKLMFIILYGNARLRVTDMERSCLDSMVHWQKGS